MDRGKWPSRGECCSQTANATYCSVHAQKRKFMHEIMKMKHREAFFFFSFCFGLWRIRN